MIHLPDEHYIVIDYKKMMKDVKTHLDSSNLLRQMMEYFRRLAQLTDNHDKLVVKVDITRPEFMGKLWCSPDFVTMPIECSNKEVLEHSLKND